MSDRFYRSIAMLVPIGQTESPGPVASWVGIPIGMVLNYWMPPSLHFLFLVGLCAISWHCINRALPTFSEPDPSEIVLDEVCGICVSFWFIPQVTFLQACVIFLLFRFFDASKTGGISLLERLPGAWGVLLDDVAAGLYARFIFGFYMFLMYST